MLCVLCCAVAAPPLCADLNPAACASAACRPILLLQLCLKVEVDVGVHLLLDYHELPGLNLLLEPLIDIMLHDTLAQLLAHGAQFGVRVAGAGDAQTGRAARIAREGHRDAFTLDGDRPFASVRVAVSTLLLRHAVRRDMTVNAFLATTAVLAVFALSFYLARRLLARSLRAPQRFAVDGHHA